jgi:hypothetical protein
MKILENGNTMTFILSNKDLKEINRSEKPLMIETLETKKKLYFITEEAMAKLELKTDRLHRKPKND